MKIAIVLPTRGLVFTEVEQAIEQMRMKYDIEVFRSHGLGIPAAQNNLTDQALRTNPDYILFIEEDTVPPIDGLKEMLKLDADIAFIDYGVNGWSCSAKMRGSGSILWCGFGCTLIKKEVFDKLEKPYFRTDKSLRLNDWTWIDNPMKYGGQDIWFCMKAKEVGIHAKQAKGECRHLQVKSYGRPETNAGRHIITSKSPIQKFQIIERPDDMLTTGVPTDNVELPGNTPLPN